MTEHVEAYKSALAEANRQLEEIKEVKDKCDSDLEVKI